MPTPASLPPRIEVVKETIEKPTTCMALEEVAHILNATYSNETLADPDYELARIAGTDYYECLFTPDSEFKSLWALVRYLVNQQELVGGPVDELTEKIMRFNGWTTIPFEDGKEITFKIPSTLVSGATQATSAKATPRNAQPKTSPEEKDTPTPKPDSYTQEEFQAAKDRYKDMLKPTPASPTQEPEEDPLESLDSPRLADEHIASIRNALPKHLQKNSTAKDIYTKLIQAIERGVEKQRKEGKSGSMVRDFNEKNLKITRVKTTKLKKRIEVDTSYGLYSIPLPQ